MFYFFTVFSPNRRDKKCVSKVPWSVTGQIIFCSTFCALKGTPLPLPWFWDFSTNFEILNFVKLWVGGYKVCSTLRYFILKLFYIKSMDSSYLRQQKCVCTHQAQPSSRIITKNAKICNFQSSNVLQICLPESKFYEKLKLYIK